MPADGQDYVFERTVANPAIEDGNYKSAPSEWMHITHYMESELDDTMVAFVYGRHV